MRQSEVYEFDTGQGHISVPEHDVLRLERKMEEHVGQNSSADSSTGVMSESGVPVEAAKAAFSASIRGKVQELESDSSYRRYK